MEAATVPGGEAVEGQEQVPGNEQEPGQEQEGKPDQDAQLQPIFERFDQMSQDLKADMEQRFSQLQEAAEPGPDPVAQDLHELTENEDLDPQDARAIVDRIVRAQAEELVAPLAEELADLRGQRELEQLVKEFPEFEDKAKLDSARQAVYDQAMEMSRGNEQLSEWLASQRQMIRQTYLAGTAQRAEGEQPGGAQGSVELEPAGAASPGQGDPDEALRKSIREAGGERNTFLTG